MTETLDEDDLLLLEYSRLYSEKAREYLSQKSVGSDDQSHIVDTLKLKLKDHLEVEVKPVNEQLTNRAVKKDDELGESWDPLKEREITPEIAREWRAIQLRGFVDPKKFYKNSTTMEPVPTRFDIGVIREPLGVRAGPGEESQAYGTSNSRKRKHGVSIVNQLLSQDQTWTKKKYKEIQTEKSSGKKGWYHRQLKKRRLGKKRS